MKFLDIFITLPEFFFINVVTIFLFLGLYLRYITPTHLWAKTFGFYSIFLLILYLLLLINTNFENSFAFNTAYLFTITGLFLKILLLLFAILIFFVSIEAEKTYKNYDAVLEIWFIRLLVIFSLNLVISANDLISIFFALELYALSSYILIGYRGKFSVFSSEVSIKYFILGTVFSIIFVYGISLFYMSTGLTNLYDISAFINLAGFSSVDKFNNLNRCAAIFLFIGVLFKLAASPFHFWSPDVYDGSPTTMVLFLATLPKIALLALLMKLNFLLEVFDLSTLLFTCGILSVLIGSIGGLFQKRIKRLLAYSMINNTGFLVLAVSIFSITSASFVIFFLIMYLLTLIGLFGVILSLRPVKTSSLIKNIYGLSNLFFINKALTVSLIIFLFTSAGLPPLVGFLSKFFVLLSLVNFNSQLFYILVLILILAPLSGFYYIRILKFLSFNKKRYWIFFYPISTPLAYIVALNVFLAFLSFWLSGFLLIFTNIIFL